MRRPIAKLVLTAVLDAPADGAGARADTDIQTFSPPGSDAGPYEAALAQIGIAALQQFLKPRQEKPQ